MTPLTGPTLLALLLLPAQAPPPPADALLGRWESLPQNGPAKAVLEFLKGGTLKIRFTPPGGKEVPVAGTYKVPAAGRLELELTFEGVKGKQALKYALQGDELTTTDDKGQADKFKRLK